MKNKLARLLSYYKNIKLRGHYQPFYGACSAICSVVSKRNSASGLAWFQKRYCCFLPKHVAAPVHHNQTT